MRLGVLVFAVGGLVVAGCSNTLSSSPWGRNASFPPPSASAALPDPNAPFTWPRDLPAPCSERQSNPQPGVLVGDLLMDPADRWPGPWTGATEFSPMCVWAEVGKVDYAAKTVQLLMKDTKTGAQKAFTGRVGDVVSVGRFTVKIDPPRANTAAQFEVDIYWADPS